MGRQYKTGYKMVKVLIICAGLQYGGVERFSANICAFAPDNEFSFDYLVFEGLGDAFAPEIEHNGGRVLSIPSPSCGYIKYIKNLSEIIKANHYDVIHSHTQFNSGLNLWIAKKQGVPIRIAHSHTTAHEKQVSYKQRVYEYVMRYMICKYSTNHCACGIDAGKWMYGKQTFEVITNGINTEAFVYSEKTRHDIRTQYMIEEDAFVIGHSGTISKLKNQEMLIRLLPAVIDKKQKALLMLLGTGEDSFQRYLKDLVNEMGIQEHVIFTDAVMNVNQYLSAFDVFAFPSLREGTPIALLEAQANGLPCIISDVIPEDVCITDLVRRLPLDCIKKWVDAILEVNRPDDPGTYGMILKEKGYDVYSSYSRLYDIYRGRQ